MFRDSKNCRVGPPASFVGPISAAEAEALADQILDDEKTRVALVQMLTGDIDPKHFAYDVQVLAEAYLELSREPEADEHEQGLGA